MKEEAKPKAIVRRPLGLGWMTREIATKLSGDSVWAALSTTSQQVGRQISISITKIENGCRGVIILEFSTTS